MCTSECRRNILGRHENDDWLVEVLRHLSEGRAVVGVDDQETRPAGERVKIAGIEAATTTTLRCEIRVSKYFHSFNKMK